LAEETITTIKDVAQRAGVSVTTVSHVINKTRFVSDELKQKVLKAMEELSFKPNAVARSLRVKESNTIGLIIPDSTNPYFAEIGWGVEYSSRKHGYSVILCNSDDDLQKEESYINVLIEKQVDGIIIVAAGSSTAHLISLQERNIPTVMFERDSPDVKIDSVQVDNKIGGQIATRHLIELGHTRIACITGPREVTPSYSRFDGYKEELERNGIEIRKEYIIKGDFKPQGGYEAAEELLNLAQPPTAIFACNDLMAIGVSRAVIERGMKIPGDISLIGFDDIYLSKYTNPPLTTIKQPRLAMCEEAVNCLLSRMQDLQRSASSIVVNVELVKRASTASI